MNILIYRYGCICEPDIIDAFHQLNIQVIEEATEVAQKSISDFERIENVEKLLKEYCPVFTFSFNFYPAIAKICHIYKIPYLFWTVDSPVTELFDEAICLDTNRIFLFDGAQYADFSGCNPDNTYHLPLAAAINRFDQVIESISDSDRQKYSHDISFVGSLYSEKSPLHDTSQLSDQTQGYIDGLVEASLQLYGFCPVSGALSDKIIQEMKNAYNFFSAKSAVAPQATIDRYTAAHSYIGYRIAEVERERTLNTLAKYFPVDLYTRSDTRPLESKIIIHNGAKTLTEMPKIFHLSKINLNMTIKPIQTGLPLRIFDIMGCGGFLITNYQTELTDLFEIGTDLEAYGSMDELVDKCAYYLTHDEERERIARNGYEKVKANHQYIHRINSMLQAISHVH